MEGQSLKQREKKRRKKEKRKKNSKIKKPKDVGHFLVQDLSQNFDFCTWPSQNAVKRDASRKKGKLLCCKCLFDQIKDKGAFVWEYSGIKMYSGIYSGYSAPGSRIARMESRYSGMRIAPKQTLTCIIPIILIPD